MKRPHRLLIATACFCVSSITNALAYEGCYFATPASVTEDGPYDPIKSGVSNPTIKVYFDDSFTTAPNIGGLNT